MENRTIAAIGVVGLVVLAGVWWLLGSGEESLPARTTADEPEVVTPEEQERLDKLDELWGELQKVADERGEVLIEPEPKPSRPERFDASAMADTGMSDREIERVRQRFETLQGEEARLRADNRAIGRGVTPVDLQDVRRGLIEMREDLGDENFDHALYAAGEDNRVAIKKVMPRSPTNHAGLLAGDLILVYNGKNVYTPMDLHEFARDTRGLDDPVPVTYERNGQVFNAEMKAGDVGALLVGVSVRP